MYRGYVLLRDEPTIIIQVGGHWWMYSYVILPQTKDRNEHIFSVAELGYN